MPRWMDHEVKRSRLSWPTWWNPISTKNTKINWTWWPVPVVAASWEAEARESLESRRRRLQWAKIAPLHSSLVTEQDSISKKIKLKSCCLKACIRLFKELLTFYEGPCSGLGATSRESNKIKDPIPMLCTHICVCVCVCVCVCMCVCFEGSCCL